MKYEKLLNMRTTELQIQMLEGSFEEIFTLNYCISGCASDLSLIIE